VSGTSLTGIHHLEFTVRDLEASVEWYTRVFGLEVLARADVEDRKVVMLPVGNLILGLVQHPTPSDEPFDERRTGLDHVGFRVAAPEDVDAWAARFDELGVARSEVKDGVMEGSRLVVVRDPDEIQVECYYAPKP
jgi:glyoxylase I family protein